MRVFPIVRTGMSGLGDAWGSETPSGAVGADAGSYYPGAVGTTVNPTTGTGGLSLTDIFLIGAALLLIAEGLKD